MDYKNFGPSRIFLFYCKIKLSSLWFLSHIGPKFRAPNGLMIYTTFFYQFINLNIEIIINKTLNLLNSFSCCLRYWPPNSSFAFNIFRSSWNHFDHRWTVRRGEASSPNTVRDSLWITIGSVWSTVRTLIQKRKYALSF